VASKRSASSVASVHSSAVYRQPRVFCANRSAAFALALPSVEEQLGRVVTGLAVNLYGRGEVRRIRVFEPVVGQ
jgi:hypothetical protein